MIEPLPQIVVPLFLPNEHGAFDFFATATLLRFRNRHFVATAAHVKDGDRFSDQLMVVQSPRPAPLAVLPEKWLCSFARSSEDPVDRIDLAASEIDMRLADGLRATGASFFELDSLTNREVKAGDEIAFVGFPGQKQHAYPFQEGMHLDAKTAIVWTHQVVEDEASAPALKSPLQTHLVGRFRHKATRIVDGARSEAALDDPSGMSGGVAWHIIDCRADLGGIMTRWNPDGHGGHLIATRAREMRKLVEVLLSTAGELGR